MREEFDPVTEIIGPLITLINVKDKKAHGVAIETAAGGIVSYLHLQRGILSFFLMV